MAENKKEKECNVPNLRFPEFSGEWEKCTIGELAIKVGSGVTPRGGESVYKMDGHPFVRSQNVGLGHLILNDIAFIDEETHLRQKSTELKLEDVLLNITGASIGRSALVNEQVVGGNVNQHVCIIRTKENLISSFLCNFLLSNYGQRQIDSFQAGGNRQGLNFEQIKSIKITIPSTKEQTKVAKLLQLIEERIATQNKIIEDLKKLKSAIRKKVFVSLKGEYTECYEIHQLLTYEQPTAYIVANDEYSTDTNLIPVLTANKGFVLGYTNEDFGIYQKGECIIFDDFTMDAKYVAFPFKVKSSAIKILTAKPNVNLRFMFEYLSYLELKSEEHKRHYISEIASLVVELPSKEMQDQITSLMTLLGNKLALEEKAKVRYENEKQYLLSQMFI